ncbi:hypothetical protein ACLB2K_077331 [Fragaria x ananassa]
MVKLRHINKSICSLTINDEIIIDMSAIETHVVQHFEKAFTSDPSIVNTGLVERLITCMVSEEENSDLLALPSYQEIHDTVMCMDGFSAPGPYGFNGSFYKFCWPIVDSDVVMVVRSFFENGYIMPHFNSNVITLIPKLQESERVYDYKPIALANFSFKIITKILANRLGRVVAKIVSPNQSAFIVGHTILDPITQTSKCVNLLNNSCKYGNVEIKFDISKAFDTLDWCFLLRVLETFGFHPTFTRYVEVILQSAYLSVNVNGKACGFFTCSRGVRQGDPLSPLLFCLAEEVLSRGLADLATRNKIKCFKAPGGVTLPTHVLFADDVMIFTQGRSKYLSNLMSFMEEYAQNSGQVINTAKSQLFLGKSAIPRQMRITNILGINVSVFPFTYLGVPIFVGRPKSAFLLPIADRIKAKLSSGKGRLLSQAGRLQLIESVIQSQLLYSFQVYEWSQELLKKVQR